MSVAYVVADSVGAVGAFASLAEVVQIAFAPYSAAVLGVYEFPIGADAKEVFVLPYKEINAVAFASDDLELVRAAQKRLLALGLTYPEDPAFWRCELGRLTKAGQARLALGEKAIGAELEKEHAAVLSRYSEMLEDIKRDSPLARLLLLSEAADGRINLMQSIIPCKLSAADDQMAADAKTPAVGATECGGAPANDEAPASSAEHTPASSEPASNEPASDEPASDEEHPPASSEGSPPANDEEHTPASCSRAPTSKKKTPTRRGGSRVGCSRAPRTHRKRGTAKLAQ